MKRAKHADIAKMMLLPRTLVMLAVMMALSEIAICGNTSTTTLRLTVTVVPTVQVLNPTQSNQLGPISMGNEATLHLVNKQEWDHVEETGTIRIEPANEEKSKNPSIGDDAVLIRHTYIPK